MPHPIDILRNNFKIPSDTLDKIHSLMVEQQMPKGSIIDGNKLVRENSYYILSGAARAFYTRDGKEHTMSFAFDDEFLMTHMVLNSVDIPLTITFMEDSQIVYVPIHSMRDKLKRSIPGAEAMVFLNASLISYNSFLEERIYTLQCMTATERYNWALDRYPNLLKYATVTQIASFLGVTKETLYRIRSGKY